MGASVIAGCGDRLRAGRIVSGPADFSQGPESSCRSRSLGSRPGTSPAARSRRRSISTPRAARSRSAPRAFRSTRGRDASPRALTCSKGTTAHCASPPRRRSGWTIQGGPLPLPLVGPVSRPEFLDTPPEVSLSPQAQRWTRRIRSSAGRCGRRCRRGGRLARMGFAGPGRRLLRHEVSVSVFVRRAVRSDGPVVSRRDPSAGTMPARSRRRSGSRLGAAGRGRFRSRPARPGGRCENSEAVKKSGEHVG